MATSPIPTKDGKHLESIPSDLVQVYKHNGNNNYKLVKDYGNTNNFNNITTDNVTNGLAGMLTGLFK